MPDSNVTIIDTSALYAILIEDDRFHEQAQQTLALLLRQDFGLVTTSYALSEVIGLMHRRRSFDAVDDLLAFIADNVTISWTDEHAHQAALQEFIAARGQPLSLVDWTLITLSREAAARIFTFDQDMVGQGASVIPAAQA